MAEQTTPRRLTYMGRRFNRSKKLSHCYQWADDPEGEPVWLKWPCGSGKRGVDVIGWTYEGPVSRSDDGHMFHNMGNWKHVTHERPDETVLVEWRAEDAAAQASFDAESARKKARADDPMMEGLRPWREAWSRANYKGKTMLIARVLEYIQRGG